MQRLLLKCDTIVVEGVGGRRVLAITLSYRIASRFGRGGLVMQGRAMDLSVAEFSSGWKGLSVGLRWGALLLSPLMGLWLLIVGPRWMFAQIDRNLDDLPSEVEEQRAGGVLAPG